MVQIDVNAAALGADEVSTLSQPPPWPYPTLRLKRGKERMLTRRHPWVFSGAVVAPPTAPVMRLADANGHGWGVGTASPASALAFRCFRFEDAPLDADFFAARFARALSLRDAVGLDSPTSGCRWIFGEADGLPGLVVDRYAHALVVQVGTAGLEALRAIWWPILRELAWSRGVRVFVERSKSNRKDEGLLAVERVIEGDLPSAIEVREGAALLTVDLLKGQKTGFFLDQRPHRLALGRVSQGCRVLNAFGYTGGFSIHAGLGGAEEVTTLDISTPALEHAQADWVRNGLDPARHVLLAADAFDALRALPPGSFDRVIIDPPAFAKQRKDVERAFKAYKDVFRLGALLTKPGGFLWCFSCSQHLDRARFQEAAWTATLEAGRDAQVVDYLSQPHDHPTHLNHPEGLYLKGLWLRV
jgi:23S rRNA (cytosine1962-C5)-methyltransferase